MKIQSMFKNFVLAVSFGLFLFVSGFHGFLCQFGDLRRIGC